jgi:hypothetical protein
MKWAVWVPWRKSFFKRDGEILLFESKTVAQSWVDSINNTMTPCGHPYPCRACKHRVVPWNEQAQAIAKGEVLP